MSKLLLVFLSALTFDVEAQPLMNRYRILCESLNYQYHQCLVREQVQDAFIVQEYSDRACIPNHAWGILQNGIWVDRGCRAVFEVVTYASRRQTYDVTCSSQNNRYQFCNFGGYFIDGFLLQQHSRANCTQGRSWGFSRDGVWVDYGCRATFRVTIER